MTDKPSELRPLTREEWESYKGRKWEFKSLTDLSARLALTIDSLFSDHRAALVAVAKLAWEEGIDAPGSASDATAERIVDKYLAERAGKDEP